MDTVYFVAPIVEMIGYCIVVESRGVSKKVRLTALGIKIMAATLMYSYFVEMANWSFVLLNLFYITVDLRLLRSIISEISWIGLFRKPKRVKSIEIEKVEVEYSEKVLRIIEEPQVIPEIQVVENLEQEMEGVVIVKSGKGMVPKILGKEKVIVEMVKQYPEWSISKYCDKFKEDTGVIVGRTTMGKFVKKIREPLGIKVSDRFKNQMVDQVNKKKSAVSG
jgi:hypothetical protein